MIFLSVLRVVSSFFFCRYVHGQRVVYPSSLNENGLQVEVLDFSVHSTDQQSYNYWKLSQINQCSFGTRIAADNIFIKPVTTYLPYRLLRRPELCSYSGVMIDDERLIGLRVGLSDLNVWRRALLT